MPLFGTFSSASSRALGLRNGSPPLPPTISAPTDNQSLTGSGNTTNRINTTVSFTSTVTSFAIARFEFKVDQLDGSNNIVVAGTYQTAASAGATSFLISNLLTSTKYGLYMRTVDIAGQVSEPTSIIRFTTAAEVAPTAPTPSLSSNALQVGIGYGAGTAGTYAIGTREFALRLASEGTTPPTEPAHYVTFTGAVTRSTRTDGTNGNGPALVPNTSYRVFFRYTASSPGVSQGTATNTISTSTEVKNSPPSVTVNSVSTVNIGLTLSPSSGGTYGVSYYEYVVTDAAFTVSFTSGTIAANTTSLTINSGTQPDVSFLVFVRAISLTSGLAGDWGSASGQLNPNTPSAPTIAFTGMTPSTTGTATMTITKTAYATRVIVNVVGGGSGANYDSLYDTSNFVDNGTYWTFTVGSQSYNSTYTYKAYVKNRIGSDSSFSNSITWNTPKAGMPYTAYSATGEFAEFNIAATNSAVAGCSPGDYSITFGSVPSSPGTVGYINITSMGVQIRRFSTFTVSSTYLYFSYPGGTFGLGPAQAPEGFHPTVNSLRFVSINVGGSSLSGQTFRLNFIWDGTTSGAARFANQGFGCLPNGNNAYYGKGLYVQGVTTLPGSGTGF